MIWPNWCLFYLETGNVRGAWFWQAKRRAAARLVVAECLPKVRKEGVESFETRLKRAGRTVSGGWHGASSTALALVPFRLLWLALVVTKFMIWPRDHIGEKYQDHTEKNRKFLLGLLGPPNWSSNSNIYSFHVNFYLFIYIRFSIYLCIFCS